MMGRGSGKGEETTRRSRGGGRGRGASNTDGLLSLLSGLSGRRGADFSSPHDVAKCGAQSARIVLY